MRMSPIDSKATNTVKALFPQQLAIGFQSYFTQSSSSLTTTSIGFQGGVLSRAPNTILSRSFTTISITLLQFSFIYYYSLQFSVISLKNKYFFYNFPIAQTMAQLAIPSTFLLLAWQYFWKARAHSITDSRPTSSSGTIYRPQSSPPPRQKRKALRTNSFENLRQYSQDASGLPGRAGGGLAATAKQGLRKDLTILLAGVGTLRQDVDSPKDQFLIFLDIILKIIEPLLQQDTKYRNSCKCMIDNNRQVRQKSDCWYAYQNIPPQTISSAYIAIIVQLPHERTVPQLRHLLRKCHNSGTLLLLPQRTPQNSFSPPRGNQVHASHPERGTTARPLEVLHLQEKNRPLGSEMHRLCLLLLQRTPTQRAAQLRWRLPTPAKTRPQEYTLLHGAIQNRKDLTVIIHRHVSHHFNQNSIIHPLLPDLSLKSSKTHFLSDQRAPFSLHPLPAFPIQSLHLQLYS